jgi:transcriptional regulator with XRE-family HTH domain
MGLKTEHERLFAERVKEIRKQQGMSCQQLADRLGMPRAALSKIECGRRRVSLGEAVLIAKELDTLVDGMCRSDPIRIRFTQGPDGMVRVSTDPQSVPNPDDW